MDKVFLMVGTTIKKTKQGAGGEGFTASGCELASPSYSMRSKLDAM